MNQLSLYHFCWLKSSIFSRCLTKFRHLLILFSRYSLILGSLCLSLRLRFFQRPKCFTFWDKTRFGLMTLPLKNIKTLRSDTTASLTHFGMCGSWPLENSTTIASSSETKVKPHGSYLLFASRHSWWSFICSTCSLQSWAQPTCLDLK